MMTRPSSAIVVFDEINATSPHRSSWNWAARSWRVCRGAQLLWTVAADNQSVLTGVVASDNVCVLTEVVGLPRQWPKPAEFRPRTTYDLQICCRVRRL